MARINAPVPSVTNIRLAVNVPLTEPPPEMVILKLPKYTKPSVLKLAEANVMFLSIVRLVLPAQIRL